MYLNGFSAEMLPLEHAGIVSSPRPRPCLPESGLAGGVVAVRLDALEAVDGADGAQVLVPKGSGRPRPGDPVAWCTVTAVAPAVLDADGRVAADGWLPDHVRLGVLEQHLGEGTIEQAVAASQTREMATGEDPPERRERIMSLSLMTRLMLLMTLLPNASYVDAMAHLVGALPRLPWAKAWQVPASTVITEWRRRLGVAAMRELFTRVAGPIVALTDPGGAWRGLRVFALDGFQARVPDSDDNRAAFGSSGTADDSSPFPLARVVVATARAGRAILAAVLDASWVGELTLATRLVAEHPGLFTDEHVYVMDRNFGSFDFLDAVHRRGRGAHFVVRVKSGVKLPVVKQLGRGEYLSHLRSRDGHRRIPVRVVEYDVKLPDGTVSELFCLATSLLDPTTHPKDEIAEVYRQRWSASETTIGESKSTITDAGPSRGPNLRSETPALVRQEIWSWLAATQLVRRAAYAATQSTTGVSTDQISFTTTRREATRSMVQTLVTATSSPAALADAADRAARSILANLVITDRDRHSPRKQKHRPRFPHTATTKPTTRGPLKPNFGASRRPDTS